MPTTYLNGALRTQTHAYKDKIEITRVLTINIRAARITRIHMTYKTRVPILIIIYNSRRRQF